MSIKLLDKVRILVRKSPGSEDTIVTQGIVLNCDWITTKQVVVGISEGFGIGLVHTASIYDYASSKLDINHVRNIIAKHSLYDVELKSENELFISYKESIILKLNERYV